MTVRLFQLREPPSFVLQNHRSRRFNQRHGAGRKRSKASTRSYVLLLNHEQVTTEEIALLLKVITDGLEQSSFAMLVCALIAIAS